jgi:hypothetical protein
MCGSYSLHICFVYPIQEKILFCWIDSLDGFSLASEQKIIYFPFYKKKITFFLMGGKDCLSLGLSLDPPISNLKEKFFIMD